MATITTIEHGGVTSPLGFSAGAIYAGVKTYGEEPRLDVGLLHSAQPCTAAGLFTRNVVLGEALLLTRHVVESGAPVHTLVANSGNANCVTGPPGAADAARMAALAAARLGVSAGAVLVGSTGVIGRPLPMDLIKRGIADCPVSADAAGADAFARAIMTTDTRPKSVAARVEAAGRTYSVGGCAKGAGMIHPDMATMFGFLTTDAPADPAWLQTTLRGAVDDSFHLIDIDMDTSTCDMVLLLANGAAGGEPVDADHPAAAALAKAITAVAQHLAREVARDGEGATALIEATVIGAPDRQAARTVARTIVASPLIKTMVTGRDPNWGRILMAAGRAGVPFDPQAVGVSLAGHAVVAGGLPLEVDLAAVSQAMDAAEVRITVDLGDRAGGDDATATAWGCNLTAEYVHINADYTT